jgi:hypothetical protein
MSVFSKLFSGSPKGETEAASTTTPEEGPSMQRPPNDGRGTSAAQQPNAPPQKGTLASSKPTQKGMPTANVPQAKGGSSAANQAPGKPASASGTRAAAGQGAPAVVVTRPIDVGANAANARSGAGASRPAMPAIQIPAPAAEPPAAPAKTTTAAQAEARNSVRPTAPDMMTAAPNSNGQASIADTFERLLSSEDLEAGFASMETPTATSGTHGVALTDLAEVRSLFAQLAANHVRQVRDFMIDLRWSDATVDWLPICDPALRSLRRAADKLELTDLCESLDRFSVALSDVAGSGAKMVSGTTRESILGRYDELSKLMPQAFALDLDRTQREAAILQSLLLQVPEVKKVTLDRMYAAGLTTLEAMFLATPGDIAATTGIPETLAEQIVERFQAYRAQVKATVPDATRAKDREHIAELTAKLRREHDDFERAADSWSSGVSKKELRKAREQTLLDIQVALARLGEVDRLAQLERLPFEKKLAHLESFLEEARDKYVAQP